MVSGHDVGHDRSGWGGQLRPGSRPALLLVDLVNAYFADDGVFALPSTASVESAGRLLDAARTAGVMVVHTNVQFAPDGSDGGVFFRKVSGLRAFAGTGPIDPAGQGGHHPLVRPRADELVVTKQMPSAFFGTTLAGTLTATGIDTVVVGGVSTSGCVRASVLDAMCHGFVPLVVADACGDRSAEVHDANLRDLQAKYAEVVNQTTALDYLTG